MIREVWLQVNNAPAHPTSGLSQNPLPTTGSACFPSTPISLDHKPPLLDPETCLSPLLHSLSTPQTLTGSPAAPLPNQPCSLQQQTTSKTPNPRKLCFSQPPGEGQQHLMLLREACLPPDDPPWVSRLLLFLSLSLSLIGFALSPQPAASIAWWLFSTQLPHPHLNPSKEELIILQLPPDVFKYCYGNTRLSFHTELPLRDSSPLPLIPLLLIRSRPFPPCVTRIHHFLIPSATYCRSLPRNVFPTSDYNRFSSS